MKYSADHQYTLKLTLHKMAFEVMVSGEKPFEFRKPSKWILSRLKRDIKYVEFTNGYGKDKPVFTAEYRGHTTAEGKARYRYSNKLTVDVEKGDVIIHLGKITEIRNYGQRAQQPTIEQYENKSGATSR